MVGIGTLKYYNNLYRLRGKGLQFSKAYQTKLYNWFPPFFEQDLWLPKIIEGRGLLKQTYHIAGHCCFCRNNDYYRNLCFKIKDWKSKITDEKPVSLDEGEWSSLVCPNLRTIRRIHYYVCRHLGIHYFKVLDLLNPILHRNVLLHEYWTSPQPKDGEQWIYDVKNGSITDYKGRSLPYLHFLFFKKTPWLQTDRYWRKDFWRIQNTVEEQKYIKIDIEGIS